MEGIRASTPLTLGACVCVEGAGAHRLCRGEVRVPDSCPAWPRVTVHSRHHASMVALYSISTMRLASLSLTPAKTSGRRASAARARSHAATTILTMRFFAAPVCSELKSIVKAMMAISYSASLHLRLPSGVRATKDSRSWITAALATMNAGLRWGSSRGQACSMFRRAMARQYVKIGSDARRLIARVQSASACSHMFRLPSMSVRNR
mmetsp:Transcript_35012/g.87318  ORF Transcript_35012/g.87318 Transcript_35012/m.87318 type:complete len:207 (+) Transcript_35012:94-714(+)